MFKDLEVTCWRYGGDGSFVWDERYGRACWDRYRYNDQAEGGCMEMTWNFFFRDFHFVVFILTSFASVIFLPIKTAVFVA